MAMSKYSISGLIRNKTKFNIEVDASSEAHARKLVIVKLGSTQKLKSPSIKITSIKKL
jgi:ribosomal protein L20A (L18A)